MEYSNTMVMERQLGRRLNSYHKSLLRTHEFLLTAADSKASGTVRPRKPDPEIDRKMGDRNISIFLSDIFLS